MARAGERSLVYVALASASASLAKMGRTSESSPVAFVPLWIVKLKGATPPQGPYSGAEGTQKVSKGGELAFFFLCLSGQPDSLRRLRGTHERVVVTVGVFLEERMGVYPISSSRMRQEKGGRKNERQVQERRAESGGRRSCERDRPDTKIARADDAIRAIAMTLIHNREEKDSMSGVSMLLDGRAVLRGSSSHSEAGETRDRQSGVEPLFGFEAEKGAENGRRSPATASWGEVRRYRRSLDETEGLRRI